MLSELQQRRFNGSDGGVQWSPMDDELLAQPQVMKLLDSLREQYTRYQEVCRQRSKRTQLEEIQQKVMQVGAKLHLVSFIYFHYSSCEPSCFVLCTVFFILVTIPKHCYQDFLERAHVLVHMESSPT